MQITEIEALIENKLGPKAFKKENYFKYACIGVLMLVLIISIGLAINF